MARESLVLIDSTAYPDGHAESTADEDGQIKHLKAKVDAGAEFIITQLFYDAESFLNWLRKVRAAGDSIFLRRLPTFPLSFSRCSPLPGIDVPVIPGVMPIQSYASFMRLTKLCGTRVPQQLLDQINPIRVSVARLSELSVSLIELITIQHDDQLVKDLGVQVAVDMIRKLSQNDVPGFHFCTLNLEKSVQRVLEQLRWVGAHVVEHNMIISVRLIFNLLRIFKQS